MPPFATTPEPHEPVGLRERKRCATRVALRDAAVRLAADRGIRHVTVDDIAAEAGVSTRTFFNYFPTKEAAVAGLDEERWENARAVLAAQGDDVPTVEALRRVFVAATASVAGDTGWERRLDVIRADPELLSAHVAAWNAAERALVEAVASRLGMSAERDLYPALAVSAAVGAGRAAFLRWRSDDGEESLADLLAAAFDALAAGLPDPPRTRTRTRATRAKGTR